VGLVDAQDLGRFTACEHTAISKVPTKEATGRRTMMKGRTLIIVLLALGVASVARAQQPLQLKFSRVVDLTLPIESNMPGIPGIKTYADNPSKVDVVTAINEAQKSQLQTEGMTLNSNLAVNGRAMISVLSILVHNGTHIDAPRHMMEKGSPIDQMPLRQLDYRFRESCHKRGIHLSFQAPMCAGALRTKD